MSFLNVETIGLNASFLPCNDPAELALVVTESALGIHYTSRAAVFRLVYVLVSLCV